LHFGGRQLPALQSTFILPQSKCGAVTAHNLIQSSKRRDRLVLRGRMPGLQQPKGKAMNQIIYIVGAIVIVIALLSFVGLR
jgi:hypothetical protein